jgi:hypothetical protein
MTGIHAHKKRGARRVDSLDLLQPCLGYWFANMPRVRYIAPARWSRNNKGKMPYETPI